MEKVELSSGMVLDEERELARQRSTRRGSVLAMVRHPEIRKGKKAGQWWV